MHDKSEYKEACQRRTASLNRKTQSLYIGPAQFWWQLQSSEDHNLSCLAPAGTQEHMAAFAWMRHHKSYPRRNQEKNQRDHLEHMDPTRLESLPEWRGKACSAGSKRLCFSERMILQKVGWKLVSPRGITFMLAGSEGCFILRGRTRGSM